MGGMEWERRRVGVAAKERTQDDINRGREKRRVRCHKCRGFSHIRA